MSGVETLKQREGYFTQLAINQGVVLRELMDANVSPIIIASNEFGTAEDEVIEQMTQINEYQSSKSIQKSSRDIVAGRLEDIQDYIEETEITII